jgi:hypothetical protein
MVPPNWINATDLNGWANRRDAQGELPQLLRRLISASTQNLQKIQFPAGDSIQMGGWDGIVESSEGNAFVPSGCSVWELGVNKDIKGKADDDYQKRCSNSLGLITAKTTFIFVTPRRWVNKEDWVRSKNSEGTWSEVKVYDANDLEQWLELTPAVHRWLACLLGKWSDETQDLGNFWDEWTHATEPHLTSSLHLSGREKDVAEVKSWLNKSPSSLTIQSESCEEVIAFFASIIHEMPENEQINYLSRCIIVKSESSWRYLSNSQDSLILIPTFNQIKSIPRNHHVLVSVGREISPSKEALKLACLSRKGFNNALIEMGFSEERAYTLAKECKRSLLVLRRLLASTPEIHTPNWATPENGRLLIPTLLAGAWDETKEADRDAVASLAGKPYKEVTAEISHWINTSDPPIRKIGNVWQVVSREVTWHFLSRFLIRDDLEIFENVACTILGMLDPRYELQADQRFAAIIYGKELPHSSFLRRGVSETLAILSTRGLPSTIQDTKIPQERVNIVVHKLLMGADWVKWASLSSLLPILAEAAPEKFLEVAEEALTGETPTLLKIFQESVWGSSPHIGLLWALEIFAWEPIYLSRVALILAKLSKLDPGGKLLSRPFNSLREIFLCWHPKTPATLQQRLRVIDTLLTREPMVAWQFLCSLLPEASREISGQIYQPRWRDWNPTYTPSTTWAEYWQSIEELIKRIIDNLGNNVEKWHDLIKKINSLPENLLGKIICAIERLVDNEMEPADLAIIWNEIGNIIHKYREFANNKTALKDYWMERLYLLYEDLTPPSFIYRYSWLFTYNPRFITSVRRDWEDNQEILRKKQIETVQEIFSLSGISALIELASYVEQPYLLGWAMAKSEDIANSEHELFQATLGQDAEALNNLAIGFVTSRMDLAGWKWAEETLQSYEAHQWSPKQITNYFLGLPFEKRTWELLKLFTKESQKLYWQTVPANWVKQDDAEIAINDLLKVNRPYAALDLAGSCLISNTGIDSVKPMILVNILKEAALADSSKEASRTNMTDYYIDRIFNVLEKSNLVATSDIARLEWIYLPILTCSERQPRILYQELASNPLFFAEIVEFIDGSENDQDSSIEVDQARSQCIRRGHELLNSWHQVPGLTKDGIIDTEKLRAWVSQAREACHNSGRGKVGDKIIGEVLANAPKGIDGIWPDLAIREIVQESESQYLELGIEIGVHKNRGVWSKSIGDGGIQEREIAQTYQNYASAIADTYPRTAAMLRKIARSYESDAHQEDIRSELEDW